MQGEFLNKISAYINAWKVKIEYKDFTYQIYSVMIYMVRITLVNKGDAYDI